MEKVWFMPRNGYVSMKKAARGACGRVVLDHFIQPAFQPESF